jgi:hypothetical protein
VLEQPSGGNISISPGRWFPSSTQQFPVLAVHASWSFLLPGIPGCWGRFAHFLPAWFLKIVLGCSFSTPVHLLRNLIIPDAVTSKIFPTRRANRVAMQIPGYRSRSGFERCNIVSEADSSVAVELHDAG